MHTPAQQSSSTLQAEHQVHVLHTHLRAAFSQAIQHAEYHNAIAFFIHIQTDITVITAGHGVHPGVRFVLPGDVLLFGMVVDFYKFMILIKCLIHFQQRLPG